MKPRLHVHSDCSFFSGAESMMGNILGSQVVLREYDVSFSYRYSQEYERGFQARVSTDATIYPLRLWDTSDLHALSARLPRLLDRSWKLLLYILQVRYLFLVLNTIRLRRFFRDQHVDILHVNNGGFPAAYSCNAAVLAARLVGIPRILYVVNNVAAPYASPLRWTDYPFDRLVARSVTVFVTGSRSAATALRTVLRLPAERVRSFPNGVTPRTLHESREDARKRWGVAGGRTVVVMAAVIETRKGHAVLLRAMRMLRELLEPADMPTLLIAGAGTRVLELKALIRDNGLDDCVRYLGAQEHVFDLLNAADVVVLPSVSHEDFPNVTLEAMSLGKAVVASRLAGLPEQIEDMQSGLLVNPGDAGELAQALLRLEKTPGLRENLGRSALARFNDLFRADVTVARYLGLYAELSGSPDAA